MNTTSTLEDKASIYVDLSIDVERRQGRRLDQDIEQTIRDSIPYKAQTAKENNDYCKANPNKYSEDHNVPTRSLQNSNRSGGETSWGEESSGSDDGSRYCTMARLEGSNNASDEFLASLDTQCVPNFMSRDTLNKISARGFKERHIPGELKAYATPLSNQLIVPTKMAKLKIHLYQINRHVCVVAKILEDNNGLDGFQLLLGTRFIDKYGGPALLEAARQACTSGPSGASLGNRWAAPIIRRAKRSKGLYFEEMHSKSVATLINALQNNKCSIQPTGKSWKKNNIETAPSWHYTSAT